MWNVAGGSGRSAAMASRSVDIGTHYSHSGYMRQAFSTQEVACARAGRRRRSSTPRLYPQIDDPLFERLGPLIWMGPFTVESRTRMGPSPSRKYWSPSPYTSSEREAPFTFTGDHCEPFTSTPLLRVEGASSWTGPFCVLASRPFPLHFASSRRIWSGPF